VSGGPRPPPSSRRRPGEGAADLLFDDPTFVDKRPRAADDARADDDTTAVGPHEGVHDALTVVEPDVDARARDDDAAAHARADVTTEPERAPPVRRASAPAIPRAGSDAPPGMPRRARFFSVAEGEKRFERYELMAEVASGGMATVFLARLQGAGGFQRLVAVKRLHPHLAREEDFIQMFLDEARIAARIHHAHVVPILEIGTSEGDGFYLVMEYVEGVTLLDLATYAAVTKSEIPRGVVLRVVLDTLSGLTAAHELADASGEPLHVVHRDVSPSNVLIGVDGSARLTDFGVARAETRLSSTLVGTLKGKVAYMAPEQAKRADFDHRADLFAMGVILWEMLCGRRLFKAETKVETLTRVMTLPIPSVRSIVPSIGAELDAACARALARNPEARYQTALELAEALEKAAGAEVASTRQVAELVQRAFGRELAERKEAIRAWGEARGDVGSIPPLRRSTRPPSASSPGAELPAASLAAPKVPVISGYGDARTPAPRIDDALAEPFTGEPTSAQGRSPEPPPVDDARANEPTVAKRRSVPSIPDDVPPPGKGPAGAKRIAEERAKAVASARERGVHVSHIIPITAAPLPQAAIEPPTGAAPAPAPRPSSHPPSTDVQVAEAPASRSNVIPKLPAERVALSPAVVASIEDAKRTPIPSSRPPPAEKARPEVITAQAGLRRLEAYSVSEPTVLKPRPKPLAQDSDEPLTPLGTPRPLLGYVLVAVVAVAVAAALLYTWTHYQVG
jgi:serine/threonine-protein kinase